MARYTLETARSLAQRHGDLIAAYVLNPDLPPPGEIEAIVATGRVQYVDDVEWQPGAVWHAVSPIELGVPIDRQWPLAASRAGARVAVTVHDLIPERLPESYLADSGLRRRFRTRLEFIRHADLVFAISVCTANDTIELLGIGRDRIAMVGSAPAAFFVPAADRSAARTIARTAIPGLREQFVLYTGGMDDRKNLEGLLAAWARVAPDVRVRWQLAIACRANELELNHYRVRAAHHGVTDSVLFTGYVVDDVLLALNQSADLAVFPSLYEGFGLPVVEALSCGTPVVASNTSCLPELLDEVARFDPSDPSDMARAITDGLTDETFRNALLTQVQRPIRSWNDVADGMADGYRALLSRPSRAPRTRTRVAFVSPMPPQRTGVGEWSYLLVDDLRRHCAVDVLADGFHLDDDKPVVPGDVDVHPARSLRFAEAAWGGYDCVIYNLGNSEFHAGALAELRRRSGVVIAHEVRLTDLYALSADRPGAVPEGFAATVAAMYPGVVDPHLLATGRLTPDDSERLGIWMAREVIAMSTRFFVTNEFAAELARIDAGPALADRVEVMPFAIFPPNGGAAPAHRSDAALIASFGLVHAIKRPLVLVEAFAALRSSMPAAELAFVGRCSEDDEARIRDRADQLGVSGAITITGALPEDEYAAWHARATIAVQLRSASNGESSGAIGNALCFGVPTIAAALGGAREIDDDAVVKVPPTVDAAGLSSVMLQLLRNERRRDQLRRAALRYADEHSHARVADWLYENVIAPATRA